MLTHSKGTRPVIVSGYSSQPLARSIAEHMNSRVIDVRYKQHPNKEIEPAVLGNVRGHEVILVASASGDPNKQIFETEFLLDTVTHAGAKTKTLVIPNMWYGRSDSDWGERKAIAVTRIIKNLRDNCDNVIVADPHNQILTKETFQATGRTHCIVATFAYPFAVQLNEMFNRNAISKDRLMFLHPDAGSVKRISPSFRNCLQVTLGLEGNPNKDNWPQIGKDRDKATNLSAPKEININVSGQDVVMFDDMLDSAGTACDLAAALKEKNARSVTIFATNGLFTAKENETITASIDRVNNSQLDYVFVTNTFDHSLTDKEIHKAIEQSSIIHKIDVSAYLAGIIEAVHMPVDQDTPEDANSISAILRGRHPDQGMLAQASPLKRTNDFALRVG